MRRALALLCLTALAACHSEFSDSEALFRVADTSGKIEVPLVGVDAAGHKYQLRGATFEVSGTAMVTLSDAAAVRTLETPLPMGSYQLYLRPGYQVIELADNGSEHPVQARLSSANPSPFSVHAGASGRLKLAFRHGDVSIAFGAPEPVRHAQAQTSASTLAAAR